MTVFKIKPPKLESVAKSSPKDVSDQRTSISIECETRSSNMDQASPRWHHCCRNGDEKSLHDPTHAFQPNVRQLGSILPSLDFMMTSEFVAYMSLALQIQVLMPRNTSQGIKVPSFVSLPCCATIHHCVTLLLRLRLHGVERLAAYAARSRAYACWTEKICGDDAHE